MTCPHTKTTIISLPMLLLRVILGILHKLLWALVLVLSILCGELWNQVCQPVMPQ